MKVVIDTLSFMAKLDKMNTWFYARIKPYLGERILEAGCGNGNLISYLLDRELVVALDNDEAMLEEFNKRFSSYANVKVFKSDLEHLKVEEFIKLNLTSIVCINTLEHLKDETLALKSFNKIIRYGNLITLIPAIPWLYCPLDEAAGHYRRYKMNDIVEKLKNSGFDIIKKEYFNFFGIIGWVLNGKILRRKQLSQKLLGLFDLLTPFFNLVEKLIGPPIGLSMIVVCRKMR